jgi:hypothetical protein
MVVNGIEGNKTTWSKHEVATKMGARVAIYEPDGRMSVTMHVTCDATKKSSYIQSNPFLPEAYFKVVTIK